MAVIGKRGQSLDIFAVLRCAHASASGLYLVQCMGFLSLFCYEHECHIPLTQLRSLARSLRHLPSLPLCGPITILSRCIGHWDGVVFVHSGPFEGGMFRFRVIIDEGYPTNETPRVFFQTTVGARRAQPRKQQRIPLVWVGGCTP
jgi:hypothetical protein